MNSTLIHIKDFIMHEGQEKVMNLSKQQLYLICCAISVLRYHDK